MPTLTLTVGIETDDELDDSMAILEQQIAEALGFLGEVQTCDICMEDEPRIPVPADDSAEGSEMDEQLTALFESDLDEYDKDR